MPSKPSMEVEVEVVPPCQTEYPPVLKAMGPAAYQSSDLGYVLYPGAQRQRQQSAQ